MPAASEPTGHCAPRKEGSVPGCGQGSGLDEGVPSACGHTGSTCHPLAGPHLPSLAVTQWEEGREPGGRGGEREGGKKGEGRGERGKGGAGRLAASSPAHGTHEAVRVVGLAQRRHHLALDELVTAEAAGAVQPLVVLRADVLALAHEEAALGQVAATCWGTACAASVSGWRPSPRSHHTQPSPDTGSGGSLRTSGGQVQAQTPAPAPQPGAEWPACGSFPKGH